jgi:hypothetical protein
MAAIAASTNATTQNTRPKCTNAIAASARKPSPCAAAATISSDDARAGPGRLIWSAGPAILSQLGAPRRCRRRLRGFCGAPAEPAALRSGPGVPRVFVGRKPFPYWLCVGKQDLLRRLPLAADLASRQGRGNEPPAALRKIHVGAMSWSENSNIFPDRRQLLERLLVPDGSAACRPQKTKQKLMRRTGHLNVQRTFPNWNGCDRGGLSWVRANAASGSRM